MSGIAQMHPYNQINQNMMQSFNNWYQNQSLHHHNQMYDPYNNNPPSKPEMHQTPYQYCHRGEGYLENGHSFDKGDRTSSDSYFGQSMMGYNHKSGLNQMGYRERMLKNEPQETLKEAFDSDKGQLISDINSKTKSIKSPFEDRKLNEFGMNDDDSFRGRVNESLGVMSPDLQDSCSVSSQQDQEAEEPGTVYPWMKSSLGK